MVLKWYVRVDNEVGTTLAYPQQFILYYASAIHKHTRILKPFEDSNLTGLKVNIPVTVRVCVRARVRAFPYNAFYKLFW